MLLMLSHCYTLSLPPFSLPFPTRTRRDIIFYNQLSIWQFSFFFLSCLYTRRSIRVAFSTPWTWSMTWSSSLTRRKQKRRTFLNTLWALPVGKIVYCVSPKKYELPREQNQKAGNFSAYETRASTSWWAHKSFDMITHTFSSCRSKLLFSFTFCPSHSLHCP